MKEEWKQIENIPNYVISSFGNIKSLNYKRTGKEKILKQNINGRGYNYVNVSIDGKYKNILIHREVAKAFLKNNDIILIKGAHYSSQVYKVAKDLIDYK